ncbi:MAG: DNA polymerase I [Bacteroidota bacterium]
MEEPKRLFLLDAMALAYRSHFIFISRPLINSKGQNTSATYGFTSALLKLIEDNNIEHIAVVFDVMGAGGTFRDEMYPEYKAHRDPPPEDLLANLPIIKDMVQALDIPVIEREGVEADDVIGTLARQAEADGAEVVIVSPDKDFQQLITDRITMLRPAYRGEEFDPITITKFKEKYDLDPIQFIDILALMGDKADNVPGVHGIGEKGAMKLIQTYGTVENLLEHVDEVKGKRAKEGLTNQRKEALLSKALVTIKTDVEVDLDWHALKQSRPDTARIDMLATELEFGNLRDRLLRKAAQLTGEAPAAVEAPAAEPASPKADASGALSFDFGDYAPLKQIETAGADYTIVRNASMLEELANTMKDAVTIAFDTETTSVNQMMASLVGLSFSWEAGQGVYIPTPLPDGTSTESVLEKLGPHLVDDRLKVGHNLKYDITVLARHGVRVKGPLFDTMVAHYLIAPDDQHSLDGVARKYLNYKMVPISDLIGTGKDQLSMRDVPIDKAGPYAAEDADISYQLYRLFEEELAKEGLDKIAQEIEFPLIDVLVDVEMTGVRVDADTLAAQSEKITADLDRYEKEIYEAAGEEFKIGSTQQLGRILFEKLELPVIAKTPKGKPSTRENVLSELAIEHPLPALILDWRQLAKLKSTYVDSLGELIHPETGRIHTNFSQTVAATGRLSSNSPNLQNIPIRTPQGREVRRAFVPTPGNLLMAADYVQIELRILAHMSGDKNLIKAFEEKQDVHTTTAALVFKVPIEEVTRDQRRKAKEVNYGIPYGISSFGLAQRLRCPFNEAKELIEQYQKTYPSVSQFLARQVEDAREKGYAETLLGRRRYVPAINARNRNERSAAERISVNMPIQGTQADMIKIAMVRIQRRLQTEGLESKMILQVHDELVFSVPEAEVDRLKPLVLEEMIQALPLDVPIEVDLNVADNWLDAH